MDETNTTTLGSEKKSEARGQKTENGSQRSEGCELCDYVRKSEFDLLAHLQFNVGNNDENFMEIARLDDICDQHLSKFNRIANAKTSAKLLKFLIEKSLNGNLLRVSTGKCPLCAQLDSMESEQIHGYAGNPFENSDGDFVCVMHLEKILDAMAPENSEKTLNIYAESLRKLLSQLRVLETKGYYAAEREARTSLWRTVEKLTGRK